MSKAPEDERREREARMIHIRLAPEIHRRLRLQVAEKDTTIQEWVAALIERELNRPKAKEH